jgi:hypothetical protein
MEQNHRVTKHHSISRPSFHLLARVQVTLTLYFTV